MRKSKLSVWVPLAAVGLLAAAGVRAGEVNWSVGVHLPAAAVTVSNGAIVAPAGAVYVSDAPSVRYVPVPVGVPVYGAPGVVLHQPVVAYPQPVVAYPRPVAVAAPPVHIVPPPAVFAPAPRGVTYIGYPVAQVPAKWHKRWHREGRRHHHGGQDRHHDHDRWRDHDHDRWHDRDDDDRHDRRGR